MSCSKWRYTSMCDGRFCLGDCDLCDYDPIEAKCESCKWHKRIEDSVPYGSTSVILASFDCLHPNGWECEDNEFYEVE